MSNSAGVARILAIHLCISFSWLSCLVDAFDVPTPPQLDRRQAISAATTGVFGTFGMSAVVAADDKTLAADIAPQKFDAYQIIPDASAALSPELLVVENEAFIKELARVGSKTTGGAVWLGEHHNSVKDHNLQAKFIRSIHDMRRSLPGLPPMAIGLEQVQLQYQPVLDAYIKKKISISQMKEKIEWEKRWVWPFEVYEGIFTTARELRIPLIALNVDSEDLAEVERAGLPGLSRDKIGKYIKDPQGFARFAKPREFKDYVEYVIAPSYDLHQQMGLLRTTISGQRLQEDMSFRNFFSGRILWDESMASNAHSWAESHPGGLLIGLVGADHVKFRNGIPGRFSRLKSSSMACTSVMLNPSLIDTRPPGSVSNIEGSDSALFPDKITLQLRYLKDGVDYQSPDRKLSENTGGVLPLADYIVVG